MEINIKTNKVNEFRTICEVHREIYDILILEIEESPARKKIEVKLEETYLMAKKMDAKLKQYKHNYSEDWWEKESAEIRKEKVSLRQERNSKL